MRKLSGWLMILVGVSFLPISCDGGKKGNSDEPSYGKVESALRSAAAENQIPYRFLLGVAYMESQLNTDRSSSIYVNRLDQSDQREKSISVGQTAFGLSRKTLALSDDASGDSMDVQAKAYGKFIGDQMKTKKEFVAEPNTVEEKVRWIWELAKIHRPGSDSVKDLRLVFAKELIAVLNTGFEVQIPTTGEIVRLEKESAQISDDNIPSDMQKTFRLGTLRGEIRASIQFNLGSSSPSGIKNKPKGVTVIHCPFSLSACLQIQSRKSDEETRLGAHYIIPPTGDIVPTILQVAFHEEAVQRLNDQGETYDVQDSVVVMLVGSSGRIVKGIRNPAQPEWVTDQQLQLMGTAINQICDVLANSEAEPIDAAKCKSVDYGQNQSSSATKGVVFKYQKGDTYSWGDIPDYDESIFIPYIIANGALSGDTKFDFDNKEKKFNAGDSIAFSLAFQPSARKIELERLVRCTSADGRVIWESKFSKEVRKENNSRFELQLYDAGPNGNGDQYLRAKVLGSDDVFLGWAIEKINIRGHENDRAVVGTKVCSRTGT